MNSRYFFVLSTVILLGGISGGQTIAARDVAKVLKESEALPKEEQIQLLGDLLFEMRPPKSDPNVVKDDLEFEKVQKRLLLIPGHAIHFAYELRKRRTDALTFPENFPQYEAYAVRAFRILELMPSAETVTVTATFLDDSWTPGHATAADGCPSVNAHRILGSILQNPPKTERPFDVPAWLNWKKDIEAGKQTFMLKGSGKRYNFKGSVDAIDNAPPSELQDH